MMDNTYGSHYDRLFEQLNEEMGCEARDVEKEIRLTFEGTDMGRQLDVNEWDVVYEQDQWKVVADNGSQWSVTETEDAEAPFQFDLVSETNESCVDEEDMDQDGAEYAVDEEKEEDVDEADGGLKGSMDDLYAKVGKKGEEDKEKGEKEEELEGGEADGAPDDEFDAEQLRIGQHHELEHTDNPAVALEIAKDHLRKDPIYYTKLARMEAGECDHPEDEELYKKVGHGRQKEEGEE